VAATIFRFTLFRISIVGLCLLASFGTHIGCKSWNPMSRAQQQPPASFADNDPTFQLPLRSPEKKETATTEAPVRKKSWWDITSYMDERTQKIERDLGY
jgi:hypothetical protein